MTTFEQREAIHDRIKQAVEDLSDFDGEFIERIEFIWRGNKVDHIDVSTNKVIGRKYIDLPKEEGEQ